MLANAPVYVSLPTTDLVRARYFYETTLGLPIAAVGGPEPGNPDLRGRVVYRAGGGTMLSLYERPPSRAEHTAAFFVVDDFDQTIAELRARGLVLQDYDLPHIKTQDGVLGPSNAGRRAWFHDPDGNVLGLFEQPFLTSPEVDQLGRVEGGMNG
jgi:catechol 2,3-dioxygenase-like lactoylglutathione lyase family enzyme